MLELRRLRLLYELHRRGTIAAAADALGYTPSAVSQQIAMLEREAGVTLTERAGRGVRLTDAGLVLAAHAAALLDRAERAEADLAAASGTVAGKRRIAGFRSVLEHIALPALTELGRAAPQLRCEVVEAEPEQALPALASGDVDMVLGDEWRHQPLLMPPGVMRADLLRDPVRVVLPVRHPVARRHRDAVPLAELASAHWVAGHARMGWEEMTQRTCRGAGFDPDIRHRANDASVALALVAQGLAVALLPDLALRDRRRGLAVRALAGVELHRRIFVATRGSDAARPSARALAATVERAAAGLA